MTYTLSEEEINALHKQEFAEAADEFGGMFKIPFDRVMAIGNRTRERWSTWVHERDNGAGDTERRTHDKTKRLHAYIQTMVNRHLTPEMMMKDCDASRGTVYKFMSDNRSAFVKVSQGVYRVVDVNAERAAAGRPSVPSNPAPAATSAQRNSELVSEALSRMTGGA